MQSKTLFEDVVSAHGGRARWSCVKTIEASLSSGGVAFASHQQPHALKKLQVSLCPHTRELRLVDYCNLGWCGKWAPEHVQLLDERGRLVAERHNPRSSFSNFAKRLNWDKLDLLYFAGYALWNYLSFPFLLEESGISIAEAGLSKRNDSKRLIARFDNNIPTHSEIQTFHIDDTGLLLGSVHNQASQMRAHAR